jgi:hypothetical protein
MMMMTVNAPALPGFANEENPDQRADAHQRDGAGGDEKVHPSRRHPPYGWQYLIHDIKIKSIPDDLPIKSHGLSSGVLSPKSMFNRCIR